MERLRMFVSRLVGLFARRRRDESFASEVGTHIELLVEENIRRGMSPQDAHYAARREFGGIEQTKLAYRDQRGLPFIETLLQDVRHGARVLRKSPGFTLTAILTLALGIGANSAVFSLVDTVLLHELPYKNPERLLAITEMLPEMGSNEVVGVSAAEYLDYRDRNHSFSQMAAYESEGFNLTGAGAPLRVNAALLSASTFPMLGVNASIGRTFAAEEDRYGAPNVALLSDTLWKNHFGSDLHILGKIVKLDEKPYTVVGVMPPSFRYPFDGSPLSERADLWVPEVITPDRLSERVAEFGVHVIGRLKAGVTQQQAQLDVENVAFDFMKEHPESYSGTVRVTPRTFPFAVHAIAKARSVVLLLQAAVLCVLLIACANVANLLLARAEHRSREMAIRRAIGAGRARLLRQCLVESFLLSFLGTIASLCLSVLLLNVVRRFGPPDLPQLQDVFLRPSAFLFMFVLTLVTAISFGLIPAWRLAGVSPQSSLKENAPIGKIGAQRIQNCLAVTQIAAALVLLIGGSLLLRSFIRLLEVPAGFRAEGVVVARTFFDRARYPNPMKREAAQKEILSRLSALPGVTTAAAASHLPFSDTRQIGFLLEFAPENEFHWAQNSLVSPGYFHAMGIPLLRGRDFSEQDARNSPNVAVVSEAFVRQFLSGHDPLGQRFNWGGRAWFTVIGIAADVHISALDADPPPMIYDSMFQVESGASTRTALVLRLANSDSRAQQGLFQAVQQQLWAMDKDLPLYGTTTLDTLLAESVAQRRFTLLLLTGFAGVAVLLATIGLFGDISYLVSQRQKELAVRMALGADRVMIGCMVLRQAAQLGITGCVLGLGMFAVSSPLFTSGLYNTKRFDPFVLTAIPLLLLVVTMFAAYWPARRAMRVDPLSF